MVPLANILSLFIAPHKSWSKVQNYLCPRNPHSPMLDKFWLHVANIDVIIFFCDSVQEYDSDGDGHLSLAEFRMLADEWALKTSS